MRARRREGEGSSLSELAKRKKASLISDSVAAEMLFSFARADWRGTFSFGGGAEAGARRLGGCYGSELLFRETVLETYHCQEYGTLGRGRFNIQIRSTLRAETPNLDGQV